MLKSKSRLGESAGGEILATIAIVGMVLIVCLALLAAGFDAGRSHTREAAIKAGVGEYYVPNPTSSQTEFRFLPKPKEPTNVE